MGKPSSQLHEKENNADFLLYQLYLPKLHKNTSYYYRLNSFKETVFSLNLDIQTTLVPFLKFFHISPYLNL